MTWFVEFAANSIFLVAMGVWLGGVVFFSFFTAPVIFERLPRNTAADLISVMFPRYYNLGYFCGSAMLVAAAYPVYLDPGSANCWATWSLALIATVIAIYAGRAVMPRVRRLRLAAASSAGSPEHGENRRAYEQAHQLSMILNSGVLLLLIAQALLYGYRVRSEFFAG
ncbi:MAG: DUF4149 domain-containing protein [Planctomycetes bacterium]|nr:DUF4149 domain-containing protein [Planctomycetota bacterium]